MATQDDEAFLRKYGSYKPAPTSVPITAIKPILGGETPEEEAARRAKEAREARGGELAEEAAARAAREEARGAQKDIRDIRNDFRGSAEFKNFKEVETSTRQIIDLMKGEGSAMGDIAGIISFMKTLDPGSVVREGEFATAQNAAGVPDVIRSSYNRLISGERLTPVQRKDITNTALTVYGSRAQPYNDFAQVFRTIASDAGADPDRQGITLAPDLSTLVAPEPAPAAEVGIAREGEATLTGRDLEVRDRIQQAWTGSRGLPFEQAIQQVNDILAGYNIEPLNAATVEGLRADVNREANWQPRATGVAAGEEPGQLGAAASGMLSGYTAGLAEEAAAQFDPLAAAKLQAAGEYAEEEFPLTTFGAEVLGGAISPLARIGRAGTIGGEALRGGIYGGLYGAGEAPPEAGLAERLPGAVTGTLTGGIAGGGLQRFLGGRVPPAGGPELPPPGGMAPEAPPVGGMPPAGAAPEVAPRMAPTPAAPVAEVAEEVVTEAVEMTPQELGDLARTAVGRGPGAAKAKSQLATIAQSNPEAVNAAERLGLELPVDILSDNAQLRSLTGLARSEVGSAAETAWGETSRTVVRRAHEAMDELGAIPDLAQVSDDVRNRLNSAQDALGNQASILRKEVEQTFSKTDRVNADRARAWLQSRIDDLGGGKEGLAALSPEEKKLWGVVSKGQPTYARLNEARDQIGQALEKGTGPWSDSNLRRVKELYGALADDQINFIEDVAGKEVADKQRAANTLFQEMYKNREQMQSVFGRDLSKSLSPLMSRAITTGAKGDIKALNELVSAVPEDMRGTVLTSALFNAAKTRAGARGADETFSFTNFAKIYRDLRANKEVYKQFATAVGPQGDRLLTDLYAISRRMADAESKVLKTGKANQALANSLEAERLVNRVVKGAGGRLAAYTVGGLAGGPAGAAAAGGLTEAAQFISKGMGKNNADKLHNLLSSQDFRNLIEKIGNGEDTRGPIRKLAQSKAMRDYAKAIGFRGGQTALVQFLSGAVGPESAPGQPTPMMPQ